MARRTSKPVEEVEVVEEVSTEGETLSTAQVLLELARAVEAVAHGGAASLSEHGIARQHLDRVYAACANAEEDES